MSLYIYYLLIIFSKGDMLCFRPLLLYVNVKKLYLIFLVKVFSKGVGLITHRGQKWRVDNKCTKSAHQKFLIRKGNVLINH